MHVGLFQLDIAELDGGIALDDAVGGRLAHHLGVDDGILRHVDDEVADDHGRAGQPAPLGQAAHALVALFLRTLWRDVVVGRDDLVLGEVAFLDLDLAASAGGASAAHALDIDAELACGIQDGRSHRKPSALARWHEEHQRIGDVGGRVHGNTPVCTGQAIELSAIRKPASSPRNRGEDKFRDAAACGSPAVGARPGSSAAFLFTIGWLPPGHPGLTATATAATGGVAWRIDRNRCGHRVSAFGRLVVLVGLDPVGAVLVGAVEHIGAADRFHLLWAHRVHDRRGHAGADDHRNERGVDAMAVRQAERDVGQAAGGVDLELLTQAAEQRKDLAAGIAERADRHDQRVDDDIMGGDAKVGATLDDLLGDREADIRIHRNAGLVVGDGNDGHVVFLDQRQDRLELFFLAGDGVDQRAALGDLERRFDGCRNRAVDRQRQVDEVLNDLQRLHQQARFGLVWVDRSDTGVDVEHGRAAGCLLQRVPDDGLEIAGDHLGGQLLAAGRVDAFADHAEGLVETDDDFAGRRGDDGAGHESSPWDIKISLYRCLVSFKRVGRALVSVRGLHHVDLRFGNVVMQEVLKTVGDQLVIGASFAFPRPAAL
ncbi:protein of unknown function [Aminobacter niigataensis]|nr:protein of unknown function [Aminobacter niigataensis]